MKSLKVLILSVLMLFSFLKSNGQTVNWNTIENTNHIINVGVSWDYSLSYSAGYGYKFNTKFPILVNGNFSIPFGHNLLDDFKIKIGGQILILDNSNFKTSISLNGIYRRYENPLVRLQNFGSELIGTFGYYKPKWFIAGEIGFDKAIVTHFKHSQSFNDNIYENVKDGWYEPATGGNFLYGFQTGISFESTDLILTVGKVITQDFRSTPLIPFYLTLGFNYKLNSSSD